jgi:hypothetical protein
MLFEWTKMPQHFLVIIEDDHCPLQKKTNKALTSRKGSPYTGKSTQIFLKI